jgi:3-deoxy-D-manno-octulosonic-acid transferase
LYGKDKIENVKNHFGVPNIERPSGKLIWIHAASVGESTSALTYINHIKKQFSNLNILLTTITVTSAEILYPKIAKISKCYHQFVVADNPSWVKRFLDYWNPNVAIFLESEIWPSIVDDLFRREIPIFILNARLSPRSFKRWRWIKNFLSETLQKFNCILAQSELDRQRYAFFSPSNTKRIDNLKYANAILPCDDNILKIFEKITAEKKVFVAASTHEKEEDIILEAHKKLRKKFDLVTIIIPRHLTRIKRVCEIIKKHGCLFSLLSEIDRATSENEIYCIDTFGEVGTFFRLADVCFVGGSLIPIGGHNIYEAAALGKPVLHGQFMDNTLEIRDFLKSENLAFEVKNSEEIFDICSRLLSEENLLQNIFQKAALITRNESLKEIDEIISLENIL